MNDAAHKSGHLLYSGHFKLHIFVKSTFSFTFVKLAFSYLFWFGIERHFFKAFLFPKILHSINVIE